MSRATLILNRVKTVVLISRQYCDSLGIASDLEVQQFLAGWKYLKLSEGKGRPGRWAVGVGGVRGKSNAALLEKLRRRVNICRALFVSNIDSPSREFISVHWSPRKMQTRTNFSARACGKSFRVAEGRPQLCKRQNTERFRGIGESCFNSSAVRCGGI